MSAHTLAAEGERLASVTGNGKTIVTIVLLISLVALGFAAVFAKEVLAAGQGTPKMIEISKAVQEGAAAYLRRQFRTLAVFAAIVFLLLFLLPADSSSVRVGRSVFFLVGAGFSALVGFVGMTLATRTNLRVANAANESGTKKALRLAFRAGGVVGMFTVGLGLLGASIVLLAYDEQAPRVLEGFAFGGALLAMFMRVGGGIFTKAADVGADLVGKVEQGIPEDDPRNAATIADNVGDNVGDCAGMAADLFESYAVTLVAALILGQAAFGSQGLVFPLIVPAIGVLTALVGIYGTSPRDSDRNGMAAINRGFFLSALVSAVLVAIAAFAYLPSTFAGLDGGAQSDRDPRLIAIGAVIIGIVLASLIQVLTGYFTETNRKPVREIGKSSLTGPATVILAGISVGLESAVYSALLIGGAVYAAFLLGGGSTVVALFAVALAGTGLLTTVGVIVAMDTFGPISDNAQGIAEMSGEVTEAGALVLTSLDAVGNTTKAITKGIAIATAVLAATALFGSFRTEVERSLIEAGRQAGDFSLSIEKPNLLFGLIIGAAVVFLFSGLAINAVSRAAGRVVFEVREQFRTKPGIMNYTEKPDYARVVDICTKDSLRELATPGLLAVLSPVAVGFALGYQPLGAFLAGAIAAGVLMAVFLSNSGGAWDNAKKLVEDGFHGGKGSPSHEATIIGDTVGDPFKDTAGPALNPLIKVMNLVALLIAPTVVKYAIGDDANLGVRFVVAALAIAGIVAAVTVSNKRGVAGAADVVEKVNA
ncbi:MAG: sodium-translocating pyrophosphatase [Actinobacteria bacterium]|nr:sodium-translocating pyrophosphatase [Actinomycetota bacterium]MCA1720093.1 sodium-translocating pyrophosphatase [Actinomycetota bacterium]